jgi:hypothetical protein
VDNPYGALSRIVDWKNLKIALKFCHLNVRFILIKTIDNQPLEKSATKERLSDHKYFKNKHIPKVNIIKSKKGKVFNNYEDYKNKIYRSAKHITKKQNQQADYASKEGLDLSMPESKIDPLNITFNKYSNGSYIKDCPYKNKMGEVSNLTSASTKERNSDQKLRKDMSIDSPNFMMTGKREIKSSKKNIIVDKNNISKSDLTTPHKINLLISDKSQRSEHNIRGIDRKQSEKVIFNMLTTIDL